MQAVSSFEPETPSAKSYAHAVILSSLFGWLGVQHFYLGRWGEGLIDVSLTLGWIVAFASGEILLGVGFLAADVGHQLWVTIALLTGSFRDGEGRRVCYPGQQLPGHSKGGLERWRT
jgi:TM2 domain-containing membrane protein YozV